MKLTAVNETSIPIKGAPIKMYDKYIGRDFISVDNGIRGTIKKFHFDNLDFEIDNIEVTKFVIIVESINNIWYFWDDIVLIK